MSRIAIVLTSALVGVTLAGCSDASLTEEAEPEASAEPLICHVEASFLPDPCRFVQTAIYIDTVRGGEVRLEITVGKPVEFEPGPDAHIAYDLEPGLVNVYFPVTIKNTSDASVDSIMLLTQATNSEQGAYDGIQGISDGDISSGIGVPEHGQEKTWKHGWSMDTLTGIEYELDIDGQAGYTVTFAG